MNSDVAGFVLAGGKSSRMGTDKAFLELEGRTLLSRMMNLVGGITSEVHIVGLRSKFEPFGPVIEDLYPNRGPLGGIHAALSASGKDLNLILAVDLPLVEAAFLEYLIAKARAADVLVTVARAGGGWQPLCAIYRRGFLDLADRALQEGRNKIDPLFKGIPLEVIEESDLKAAGFSATMFQNLNTPAEFLAAKGNP